METILVNPNFNKTRVDGWGLSKSPVNTEIMHYGRNEDRSRHASHNFYNQTKDHIQRVT